MQKNRIAIVKRTSIHRAKVFEFPYKLALRTCFANYNHFRVACGKVSHLFKNEIKLFCYVCVILNVENSSKNFPKKLKV